MDLNRFIREREPGWRELEGKLDAASERGLGRIGRADLKRLVALYRQASSDLIEARARLGNAALLDYLNALVARAYGEVYQARGPRLGSVAEFFTAGFPALARRHRAALGLAAATFLAGALTGFVAVAVDPGARDWLVPAEHRDLDPAQRVAEIEGSGVDPGAAEAAALSSFLLTHNIRVACAAFALGITLGVGTVAVLFSNGVMLGALAADYHLAGLSLFFWAWVLPHGVPEIGGIFVAGGAGLLLARSLLFPGDRSLRDSFARAGTPAVLLVLGTLPFFVLAGLIEGTLSQLHEPRLPYALKLAVAAAEAAAIAAYLGSGRARTGGGERSTAPVGHARA